MVKLEELARENTDRLPVSVYNIDDTIREAQRLGIEELLVTRNEMIIATHFFIANATSTNLGAQAMREGKIDMLFGVKLTLDVPSNNSPQKD